MIRFDFKGLLITLAIFLGVQYLFGLILPPGANQVAATLAVLIIAVFLVNFVLAMRVFRGHPDGRLHNPAFHRFFLTNFVINLIFLLILNIRIFL